MRRNGFTMVELIFVIIIIGILSVAAIPKFGDIKDRAKVNSEYSSLSGLDSAAIAKIEFYKDDNPGASDQLIDWNDDMSAGVDMSSAANMKTYFTSVNTKKHVLKSIIKKGDDFKIVAFADAGVQGAASAEGFDDVLFIKGAASNSSSGVKKETDVVGKPDNNDVWVFNGSPDTVYISHYVGSAGKLTRVESGETVLIDNKSAITALDGAVGGEDAKIGLFRDTTGNAVQYTKSDATKADTVLTLIGSSL